MLSLMNIIPLLIAGLIAVVVLSWILQVSTRIICGDAIEFGDAFKAALIGVFLGIGLDLIMPANAQGFLMDLLISYAVWAVVILLIVGLTFVQSLLVAVVMKVLQLGLWLVLMAIIASMKG